MTCRSIRLTHDPIAGNKLLHVSQDTGKGVNVQTDKETANMNLIRVTIVVSALVVMGGCVAVPVGPSYYASPGYYDAPAPAYYGPPVYYGPSIGIGIYGGRHDHGRRHEYH